MNDYTNDYKSRLMNLNILPLMYTYEIADILFLIKLSEIPQTASTLTTTSLFILAHHDLPKRINYNTPMVLTISPDIRTLIEFLACGTLYQLLT